MSSLHLYLQFYIPLCVDLQIEKGKLHGSIDVGLSVMAIKKKAKCIDLDAEENIYHLKVKTFQSGLQEVNMDWIAWMACKHGLLRSFSFYMLTLK